LLSDLKNTTFKIEIFKDMLTEIITENEAILLTQSDINALMRGVYFVRLQVEEMVEVGKMVKN